MEKTVLIQSYLKESLYERISLKRKSVFSSGICSNSDVPSHHSLHWHPSKEMLKENGYIPRHGWVPSLFTWNYHNIVNWVSVQFSSAAQSCPTLCDPMNCSTPGLPVHHHLPEFTQTHVHRISDAIQTSHPLSSPFPPAPNPSQHQSLFQWVNTSHEVAKVLEFQL